MKSPASPGRKLGFEFGLVLLLLMILASLMLAGVFLSNQTLFSNDGPLGRLMAACHQLPGRFTGCWDDLNLVGFNAGAEPPNISLGLQYLLGPLWFSKLYALLATIFLGLGAWCFFANLRLGPTACVLGALAAALNSCFFSAACWGVAAQTITAGLTFFALAALANDSTRLRWPRVMLAGLAVGLGVSESADVGAIYSLYVAAFILFQTWSGSGFKPGKLAGGFGRLAVVAVCAVLVAAPAIFSLVDTYIDGISGTQQDSQTKTAHWDWATQWSLPVPETTGLVVPGLFGFRMDTPDGGNYWGEIGRDPSIDRYLQNGEQGERPHGFMRYAGGGFYAGVSVVLLCLWAVAQLLRGKNSIFNPGERKWLWFWVAVGVVSLLFAYGRFAPFYQLLYALPYFSTIRNPIKFIDLVSFALVVLFAYGTDGFWRKHMQPANSDNVPDQAGIRSWWRAAGQFEKKWVFGCGLVLVLSLVAWLVYDSSLPALVSYLETVQFEPSEAENIARFSIRQVGWFVLFFVLSAGLLIYFSSGAFSGSKARWGGVVLGLLLVADLGRANQPWVIYWVYPEKYASNPILDFLRNQPYEHRVAGVPEPWPQDVPNLHQLYREGWLQQQFPYYNIQSFDVVDMPRVPEDIKAYIYSQGTGLSAYAHLWQLTNTRYLLGPTYSLDSLNQAFDSANHPFRVLQRFTITVKPTVPGQDADDVDRLAVEPDTNGDCALFEFTQALPRVKLYSHWQTDSSNEAALKLLANPDFDPNHSVVVSGDIASVPAPTVSDPNTSAGTVTFSSYAPKDIALKSDSTTPTVLLLNDHFDPDWKVQVDGRQQPLLRCNYLMRGVYLPAGEHSVEFRFQPPARLFYVGLTAIVLGLLLLVTVLILSRTMPQQVEALLPPPATTGKQRKEQRNPSAPKTKRS